MKIKQIASIQTGYFSRKGDTKDVILLQLKDFDENGNLSTSLTPTLNGQEISEKHYLKKGDILFAAKGERNFAVQYLSEEKAVASTSFFILRLQGKNILPDYLTWYLNQSEVLARLQAAAEGSAIPSITKKVLAEVEVKLISLEKQKTIIEIHELMKKEILLRQEILNKRKEILLQQMKNLIKNEQ